MVGVHIADLEEARLLGEMMIGHPISDQEFEESRQYAEMKAAACGNDSSYVLLLIPDVISEREFSRKTFERSRRLKERKGDATWKERSEEVRPLSLSISATPMPA